MRIETIVFGYVANGTGSTISFDVRSAPQPRPLSGSLKLPIRLFDKPVSKKLVVRVKMLP